MIMNKEHNNAFFEDLCNTYLSKVYSYCKKILKGQTEYAEECTQITFLEARKQISKLRKHPNIEGWLYATARNQINMLFRKQYLKQKHEILLDDDFSNNLASLDKNIEKFFDLNIDIDLAVSDILKQLSESEYALYEDYFKNHTTIRELSIKYNISTTAVTTRIYRIKKKIKVLIQKYIENI